MNRGTDKWFGWVLALVVSVAACDDPFDNVLCAYTLSPTDEAAFSATDGQVASFWRSWDTRDYVELIPPGNCYPGRCGFSGVGDASLVIKAAASPVGLYLLAVVSDNIWVDPANNDDWGADAVDLYVDELSARDLFTCTDCIIGPWGSALSYTSQQLFVWMGGTGAPAGCIVASYDDDNWAWNSMYTNWSDMATLWGIQAEVVAIDGNTKAQEWFFPWDRFGGGLAAGTPLADRRMALSGGYNDKDGDNGDPHCLRWLGKDPWARDARMVNYWGDLLLGSDLEPVQPSTGIRAAHAPRAAARQAANAATRAMYSLTGKRIANGRGAVQAVVVDRGTVRVCALRSAR